MKESIFLEREERPKTLAACTLPGFHKMTPEPKRTIWVVHGGDPRQQIPREDLPRERKKANFCAVRRTGPAEGPGDKNLCAEKKNKRETSTRFVHSGRSRLKFRGVNGFESDPSLSVPNSAIASPSPPHQFGGLLARFGLQSGNEGFRF